MVPQSHEMLIKHTNSRLERITVHKELNLALYDGSGCYITEFPCVEMYPELWGDVIIVGIDHQGHEHRDFRGVDFHFTVFSIGFSGSQERSEKVNT